MARNYSASPNSSIAIGELQIITGIDFCIDNIFQVPFTHHIRIEEKVKTTEERYYCIHRCAKEHLSVESLKHILKEKVNHIYFIAEVKYKQIDSYDE